MSSLLHRFGRIALSPIVPASFGRAGFVLRSKDFDPEDLRVNLEGQRILVTGGTSGIGLATASALKERGADVLLVGRDAKKGERALDLLRSVPAGSARFFAGDVGDFRSIDGLVDAIGRASVDRIVHNASILPATRRETREGLEATYATNLVGPFRLQVLLDEHAARLRRVVWVSSGGMYLVPLNLRVLRGETRAFDGVTAYAHTKRAQILLAERTSERFEGRIHATSMHPGWADTPSVESSLPLFYRATKRILRSPEEGADTAIWLTATERTVERGAFYFDREKQDSEVVPGTRTSTKMREELFRMLTRDAGVPATCISTS